MSVRVDGSEAPTIPAVAEAGASWISAPAAARLLTMIDKGELRARPHPDVSRPGVETTSDPSAATGR